MIGTQSDFLPIQVLEQVTKLFEEAQDWRTRRDDESYFQTFDRLDMPKNPEIYKTEMDQSESLENSGILRDTSRLIGSEKFRCYRMTTGQHLRIHKDGYFGGDKSATIYFNRRWGWDWGGLLHVFMDSNSPCQTILPSYNTLVTIPADAPHFISPVTPWALQPRYVLAVFGIE